MKNIRTVLIGSFLFCALLTSCSSGKNGSTTNPASPETELRLKKSDQPTSHAMRVGEIVAIALEANPSTGYSWEIDTLDTRVLEQQGEADFRSGCDEQNSPIVGCSGIITFRFKALSPGSSQLKLIYRRSWEKEEAPVATFQATIHTRP